MRRTWTSLTLVLLLSACSVPPTPTPKPSALPAPTCPVTGKTVSGEGAVAYYGMYEVVCFDRAAANQFASMPVKKRAKLAGPQVLAAQGITNQTCPLTGRVLDGDAVTVKYEGTIYGFASLADANQFMALPKKKQASLIKDFRTTPKSPADPGTTSGGTPATVTG